MTQKIRGGRAILDDLKAIQSAVQKAGDDAIDFCIHPRIVEDTGRDLLRVARQIAEIIAQLEPKLERVEQRASSHELEQLEQRIAALEARVTQLDLERRGVVPLASRKQERG